ncbi:OmpA family protein [Bergeyella sp. RCAD1439]|uniref:OmpA family protein n=1 Tax=Bergeyella anatis TaxID=3113737 RepID=UPI002E17F568|nr:OmpA family protein [Bergeyella sp. RCAD1439]
MKKVLLACSFAALVLSCKKIPEGGNRGVIKMEHGTERYDDHEVRGGVHHAQESSVAGAERTVVEVDVNGAKLKAYQGGLEQGLVDFLASGKYTNAADDAALKDQWFNFDNVNFKMGSSSELEAGSEAQLNNLAAILKAYPEAKIKIGGYTDKTGDEAVNKKISQGRADYIKAQLTRLGVGSQVVSAEGYGSEFAKVPAEASDSERAADRKMAVRFTK